MIYLRCGRAIALNILLAASSVQFVSPPSGWAQTISNRTFRPFVTGFVPVIGRNGAVGGVSVNANGVVAQAEPELVRRLGEMRQDALVEIPEGLRNKSGLRKVSLRAIEEAVVASLTDGRPIPDAIQYLGGLTRIRYVFVYPQQNDVVLAGPAESWTIDSRGNVVGVRTRRPILRLEDLLVVLRGVENAQEELVSCSIDPTAEGVARFRSFMSRQRRFSAAVVAGIEKSLGPQTVTVTGVPTTSHFARVLVACDYRMKRIAMKLDESPVKGLSNYLDLLKSFRDHERNLMPRWWLACNYEPLAKSEDGLAWELRGPGVMAMTEMDLVTSEGQTLPTGEKSAVAQKWADQMTSHYDELSIREPIFGELRNLMDLSVVAALIAKGDLLGRAGLSIPLLKRPDSPLRVGSWHAPKTIATECSFVKKGRNWIITASGGVAIDSWRVVEQSVQRAELARIRASAAFKNRRTWWSD